MEKSIRYNGHTAQPSDYETPDGDLALSLGLIHEDESLRPILPPQPLFEVPGAIGESIDGFKVVFIHKTPVYTHYILVSYKDESITDFPDWYFNAYWVDESVVENYNLAPADLHQIPQYSYHGHGAKPEDDLPNFTAIGNTLVIYDKNDKTYVLWKDGNYKYLGTHLPEIGLRVGLIGHPRFYGQEYGGAFKINFNSVSRAELLSGVELSDENKRKVTEQVMGKLNKFVADTTVNNGKFCYPFLVRYALRLYDGSLTMVSAPILMNPCTHGGPIVYVKSISSESSVNECNIDMMLMASEITYQSIENYGYQGEQIDKWKDIVKSVDIFISKPMYTYNQDGVITNFQDSNNFSTKFIGKLYSQESIGGIPTSIYQSDSPNPVKDVVHAPVSAGGTTLPYLREIYSEWTYEQIFSLYYAKTLLNNEYRNRPSNTLHLPEFDSDKNRQVIENESSFYLLHSIPFTNDGSTDSLGEAFSNEVVIKTPDDYLQSLLSREVLPDDYQSHDSIVPGSAFIYNSRLNLANIQRKLFDGFLPKAVWARCSDDHTFAIDDSSSGVMSGLHGVVIDTVEAHLNDTEYLYVFIKDENGVEYIVESHSGGMIDFFTRTTGDVVINRSSCCWFFYPNPNAYKVVVHQGESGFQERLFEFQLKEHPMLNGACAMLEYDATRSPMSISLPEASVNPITLVPNKVYTSEVNNPFYFPLLGINTVGTGQILGLASATKALSQGQFGQFPLYAFTTDGVWALEVASNGSYSARQPVTRDVCISMESITQLDSSVVFATDRGLMMLQGSDAISITDDINLEDEADLSALRGLQNVCDSLFTSALNIKPLHDFMRDCRLVYDYTHQHIIVYNPNEAYAYVFSLKSKKWGMMYSTLKESLNSYPDAICVEDLGEHDVVVNYSKTNVTASTALPFVVVSRPIKFDMNDIMKTVDTIIQRGVFKRGDVKTLLYGSRDLYHWNLVYTSNDHYLRGFRGTPYKYFRIALVGALTKEGRIFGCEASFTPRLVDQLR